MKSMNEEQLKQYYNKFNEDKRLLTKHGRVEYLTAMHYIHKYLKEGDKIFDIGAGTGIYSTQFVEEGYDVSALELVKHNLKIIEKKDKRIKTYLGNAIDLSKWKDETFDVVLLFGPMYHLISKKEKLKALQEAKRVTKKGGYLFISYCMNEYAVITHGVKEGFLKEAIENSNLDSHFHIKSNPNDLYSYIRISEIKELSKKVSLKRIKMVAQDGPTEYLKKEINQMESETFQLFYQYHLSICEDPYLLGASRHILDILKRE